MLNIISRLKLGHRNITMTFSETTVTIFGGTGFLGKQIVRELANLGMRIKVATRFPESAFDLRPCGVVGQVVPVACDYKDPMSINNAIQGSDYVINCIGLLYERHRNDFKRAHVQIPDRIARKCARNNVKRFIHISALGVDQSKSRYAQTKLEGEKAIKNNYKNVTILRPSVIFGPDDGFFNMFARMAKIFPALPLIGGGKTKFQPVFVGDVADAVVKAITLPESTKDNPLGKTYEIGGPEVINFKEIYERLFDHIGIKRVLIPMPWLIARIQGAVLSLLPKPPLTGDQVISLKTDNVVSEKALKLEDLGITATAMQLILPDYLDYYRPGSRYAEANDAS